MKDIDIVITTFERPQCVNKLLKSLYKYYPEISNQVFIADQSKVFDPTYRVKKESVVNLPFDCGLGYARNYLFDATPRKYKLLLDDDFVLNEFTKIEKFVDVTRHTDADIIGGTVINPNNKKLNFEYDFEYKDNVLYQTTLQNGYKEHNGIKYRESDVVLNFGLFKKNVQRWDPQLKVCEHTDYYFRYLNEDRKIIHVPEVIIDHDKIKPKKYMKFRKRTEYIKLFMKKNNIHKIIRDGKLKYELNGNSFTKIYNKPKKSILRIKKK